MNDITRHLSKLNEAMSFLDTNHVAAIARELKAVKESGANVWIVGNGGSASTASHLANDLTKMCHMHAFSVPDLTSIVSANGNDNGWQYMYRDTIREYCSPADCIIAITFSGESLNVVLALELKVATRILITGPAEKTAAVMTLPNHVLRVMAQDITVAEDMHMIICHALCKGIMER